MVDDHDDDSVGSGNEFLESEKRRDPIEFAQKYMAKLEEIMGKSGVLQQSLGGPGVPPSGLGPTRPIEINVSVTQIENGWLVSYQGGVHAYAPKTRYVKDRPDVFKVVTQQLEAALGPDPAISDFRTPPPEGK